MLNLVTTFGSRANAATSDYPAGSYKDDTSATVKDGTPVAASTGNDDRGFRDSLLLEAGYTANNVVDTALASQAKDAAKEVFSRPSLYHSCLEAGLNLMSGSFEDGGTVTLATDVLWNKTDKKIYSWGGTLPKVVSAGSTPASSGGIEAGAWVDRTSESLRSEINIVTRKFSSVADMLADTTLTIGQRVEWESYYNGFGYGGNCGVVVAAGTGTVDGGSYFQCTGTNYQIKAQHGRFATPLEFGAKLSDGGFDSSNAVYNAWKFLGYAYLPSGEYYLNLDLNQAESSFSNFRILGEGLGTKLYAFNKSLPVIKALKGSGFYADSIYLDGLEGVSTNGFYFGNGVNAKLSYVELNNVMCRNFGTACYSFNWATYVRMINCRSYSYYGYGIFGKLVNSSIEGGTYVGGIDAIRLNSASCVSLSTDIFNETNQSNETLLRLVGCDHINFNDCRFEPQSKCSNAQVLIDGSSTQCSDIIFDKSYWLGDLSAARGAHSLRSIGVVNRTNISSCDFYVTDVPSSFYNIKIESTGEYWTIRDSYKTDVYNDASSSRVVISNPGETELRMLDQNSLKLGRGSTNTGIFADSSSGSLINSGQIYYDTQWNFITAGYGQLVVSSSATYPWTDNAKTLGSSIYRWSTVYAATGSINTSDERLKTFSSLTDAEKSVAIEIKSLISKFKFNDAISEKGEDNARWHFGVGAQSVGDVFTKYGLNPNDYGLFCYDEWEEELEVKNENGDVIKEYRPAGNRYGIRYDELICFILSAL